MLPPTHWFTSLCTSYLSNIPDQHTLLFSALLHGSSSSLPLLPFPVGGVEGERGAVEAGRSGHPLPHNCCLSLALQMASWTDPESRGPSSLWICKRNRQDLRIVKSCEVPIWKTRRLRLYPTRAKDSWTKQPRWCVTCREGGESDMNVKGLYAPNHSSQLNKKRLFILLVISFSKISSYSENNSTP